ncbi:MAG: hypothetical protein LC745_13235 [Planctomycetia bacterium]|nr:hypothetical protein [Planctomycetia bacterium]
MHVRCKLTRIALLGLLPLLGVRSAVADSGTGNQYAALTVTASVSPDPATNGTTVAETQAVKNNTTRSLVVTVTDTVVDPNGGTTTQTKKVTLKAGQTTTKMFTYTVDPSYPRGTYNLNVSATDGVGTSEAMITLTVN